MKLHSAQEVADLLGLSKSRVKQARVFLMIGEKIGSQYVYSEADIQAIRDRMGKLGRPPHTNYTKIIT